MAEQKEDLLELSFKEFVETNPPAMDGDESNPKTTQELVEMFNEFTGMDSTRFEIAEKMKNAEFTFKLIDEGFYWLLKKV